MNCYACIKNILCVLHFIYLFNGINCQCDNQGNITTLICNSLEDALSDTNTLTENLWIWNTKSNGTKYVLTREVFRNKPNLQSITIGGTVNNIEDNVLMGLKNVYFIRMIDNNIRVFPKHMAVPTLEILYMIDNKMVKLEDAFRGSSLDTVHLEGNDFKTIPVGIFNSSTLVNLVLNSNNIIKIQAGALFNMSKLERLLLRSNKIDNFNSGYIIGKSSTMIFLDMSSNQLYNVHSDTFSSLYNLEELILEKNNIETVSEFAFSNLKKLRLLSLSSNQLIEFPANALAPYHSSVREFYLNFNNLTFLSPRVISRLPDLEKISVHGNPWQCRCWQNLRNDIADRSIEEIVLNRCGDQSFEKKDFAGGKNPVCVSHKFIEECYESLDYTKEFSKIYYDSLSEYNKTAICPAGTLFTFLFKYFAIPDRKLEKIT